MKATWRRFLLVSFLPAFLLFSGCATQGDLDTVQRDANNLTKEILALQRNIYELNAEMKEFSGKMETLDKRTGALQKEVGQLNGEVKSKVGLLEKEINSSSQPMRRYQADLGARLDKLQIEVQSLTGRFEEGKYFAEKTFGTTKNYQSKMDEMEKRVASLQKGVEGLEKRIEEQGQVGREIKIPVEKGEERSPAVSSESSNKKPEEKPSKPGPAAVAGPDEAYKKAYDRYAKGDFEGAKKDFKKFLEVYPKSKYAENAHFWLGECYFGEKKYEEAILEFDEVIKRFPKGNKVADALFRQGMAFLEMRDTTNAKLILKEVIRRFPQSDQATRARKKLKDIG